jgi:predicted DNA-binding transcriptional regulator YafY
MGKRGPKAKGLDAGAERQIGELAAQGVGAAEIASRLGVSERTVSRRVAALRGPQRPRPGSPALSPNPAPASAPEGNVEEDGEEGEEDTPARSLTDEELEQAAQGGLGDVDELVRNLARDYKAAASGPLKQRIAGDYLKALDLRRKMTPPEVADPNDQPDMIKLATQVGERLHKMIDLVCEESRQG